jgi:hypothetical protein
MQEEYNESQFTIASIKGLLYLFFEHYHLGKMYCRKEGLERQTK